MDSSCEVIGIDVPKSQLLRPKDEPIMENDTVIAVDVAKSVLEIAVSDRPGHVCRRDRRSRVAFLPFFLAYPGATVVMEACGSAHYWGRELLKGGHRSCFSPPHHVRPYVQRNKTDRTDTKGILEAYRNADIRPVPVKSIAQQALTTLHRLRSGWMKERTSRLNALRGLLREMGVFIPMGAREVVPAVWAQIEDADSEVPPVLRSVLAEACQEIRDIEARVKKVERELEALAEQLPAGGCQRLASLRADSVMARSPWGLHTRGRRYVCSPSRSATTSTRASARRRTTLPPCGGACGPASQRTPPMGGLLGQGLRPRTPVDAVT